MADTEPGAHCASRWPARFPHVNFVREEKLSMEHRLFRYLGIPLVIVAFLVSMGSGTPAAAARRGTPPEAASAPARPLLPYAEYVRLVSRRGVSSHAGARKKGAKKPKSTHAARKVEKGKGAVKSAAVPAPAAASPVVAPALAAEPKRSGGWRPDLAEVHRVLATTRDLSGANLRGVNLAGADLRNATLANADLYLANLAGARLDGANLRGASLEMANLRGAGLKGAKLAGAGLFMTNLEGADLEGADLTAVYAVGANLRGAVLARANLRGGLFTRAVMEQSGQGSGSVLAEREEETVAGTVTRATAVGGAATPDRVGRLMFLKF